MLPIDNGQGDLSHRVRARYVLIDGLPRSGTNLMLECLDGHPSLRVLPDDFGVPAGLMDSRSRSAIRKAGDARDVALLREVVRLSCFGRKWLSRAAAGRLGNPKGTFTPGYSVDFDLGVFWREFDRLALDEPIWNPYSVTTVIVRAAWAAWSDRVSVDGSRKIDGSHPIYVFKNHGPTLHANDLAREAYRLKGVHMVRHPISVLASQKVRYSRLGTWCEKRFRKMTLRYTHQLHRLCEVEGGNWMSVRYEDLVARPAEVWARVTPHLEISAHPCLHEQTMGGRPRIPNSSFRQGPGTLSGPGDRCRLLSGFEYRYLQDLFRGRISQRWDYPFPETGFQRVRSWVRAKIAPFPVP